LVKLNKYFLPYIFIFILIGFKGQLIWSFIIVFFHEIMHYITAIYFGFTGFDMEILPIGTVLKLKNLDEATPKEDLIISMSGPLLNLIMAVIFYLLNFVMPRSYFNTLYLGNLALGLFNLLPALPLDGGSILRDLLSLKIIYRRANNLTIRCSIIMGFLLMLCYFLLFFSGRSNFNIGVIALFILVTSFKEKERIAYIIMGDIIKKKYKLIRRGYMENKSISIYYKSDLISILSIVDKNRYNMFTILDKDMKVMDIIYEDEVIEGLKVYGNINVEEFIRYREENI
jgi:stage IV sporulation protein FB